MKTIGAVRVSVGTPASELRQPIGRFPLLARRGGQSSPATIALTIARPDAAAPNPTDTRESWAAGPRLENRWGPFGPSWVRIPPPPLRM